MCIGQKLAETSRMPISILENKSLLYAIYFKKIQKPLLSQQCCKNMYYLCKRNIVALKIYYEAEQKHRCKDRNTETD